MLLQKLVKVGNSRAVIIPSAWLSYQEKILGKTIALVGLELNNTITISIIKKEEKKNERN